MIIKSVKSFPKLTPHYDSVCGHQMICLSQQLYITNSERYPDFKKISFDENRINVQKPKLIC